MLETLIAFFHGFLDIILHLDVKLQWVIQTYDVWTYAILFVVIFCETGLVITPFLPGDSLLFAAGAFAATGSLQIFWLFIIIAAAAILGNLLNYQIGSYLGPKVFKMENSKLFNKEYLHKTEAFYEKHGAKAIILSRFMPILRTFAPFVAGIGKMNYGKFFLYNFIGAISWAVLFLSGGYFFGNLEIVKNNFTAVIMLIIVISLIPAVKEFIQHHWKKKIDIQNK
ncbi:DedA family protein [Candidatus Woesearchaeota archaeon]|nr:DedA family protein [Candidatus Woesearchaeota archaeon]